MEPQRNNVAEFFIGLACGIGYLIVVGVATAMASSLPFASVALPVVLILAGIGAIVGIVMAFIRQRPVLGAGLIAGAVLPALAFGACVAIVAGSIG